MPNAKHCPKAEPCDHEIYEWRLEAERELLSRAVSESKPILDFIALATANVALTAVFSLLLSQAAQGLSLRLLFALLFTIIIGWRVMMYASVAFHAVATIALIGIRKHFRISPTMEDRHLVSAALVRACITTLQIAVLWGAGLTVAGILKTSALSG